MIDVFGAFAATVPDAGNLRLEQLVRLALDLGLGGGPGLLLLDPPSRNGVGEVIDLREPIELAEGQGMVGVSASAGGTVLSLRTRDPAAVICLGPDCLLEALSIDTRGSTGVQIFGSRARLCDLQINPAGGRAIDVKKGAEASIFRVSATGPLLISEEAHRTRATGCRFETALNQRSSTLEDHGHDTRLTRTVVVHGAAGVPAVTLAGRRALVSGCRFEAPRPDVLVHVMASAQSTTLMMNRYGTMTPLGRDAPAPVAPQLVLRDDGEETDFRDHAHAGFPPGNLSPDNLLFNGAFERWEDDESAGPLGWTASGPVAQPDGGLVPIQFFRSAIADEVLPLDDERIFVHRTRPPITRHATEDAGGQERGRSILLAHEDQSLFHRSADVLGGESALGFGIFPTGNARSATFSQSLIVNSVSRFLTVSGYLKFRIYDEEHEPIYELDDGRPRPDRRFGMATIGLRFRGGTWSTAPVSSFQAGDWLLVSSVLELVKLDDKREKVPLTGTVAVEVGLQVWARFRAVEAVFDRIQLNHGTMIPRYVDQVLTDDGGLVSGLTVARGAYIELSLRIPAVGQPKPGGIIDTAAPIASTELNEDILVLFDGPLVPNAAFLDIRVNGSPIFNGGPYPLMKSLSSATDGVLRVPASVIPVRHRQLTPGDVVTLHQCTGYDPPMQVRLRGRRRTL